MAEISFYHFANYSAYLYTNHYATQQPSFDSPGLPLRFEAHFAWLQPIGCRFSKNTSRITPDSRYSLLFQGKIAVWV